MAGGDLPTTTTAGAAVIDWPRQHPARRGTTLPADPSGNYPDHQGPFGPDWSSPAPSFPATVPYSLQRVASSSESQMWAGARRTRACSASIHTSVSAT